MQEYPILTNYGPTPAKLCAYILYPIIVAIVGLSGTWVAFSLLESNQSILGIIIGILTLIALVLIGRAIRWMHLSIKAHQKQA